jgi:nuclear transcription factor Y gamma
MAPVNAVIPPLAFVYCIGAFIHSYIHLNVEEVNWKTHALPLARIKRIMKSEETILQELERERIEREGRGEEPRGMRFMISGEAPIVMEKACEFMLRELAIRSWRHTERGKRRTLQRQDVYAGVGESEMFDFLIDIVPRIMPQAPAETNDPLPSAAAGVSTVEPSAIGRHHLLPTEQHQQQSTSPLSDAETRYVHLQEMHSQMSEHYNLMQQRADASAAAGIATHHVAVEEQQPQVVLNPQLMIHPPKGSAMPQWHPEPPSYSDEGNSEGNI